MQPRSVGSQLYASWLGAGGTWLLSSLVFAAYHIVKVFGMDPLNRGLILFEVFLLSHLSLSGGAPPDIHLLPPERTGGDVRLLTGRTTDGLG
jgi:hypothetical protein